ncbi:MAG: hypothetical protein ACYDGR_13340 [Candidatus Dormibacteria bacterium]
MVTLVRMPVVIVGKSLLFLLLVLGYGLLGGVRLMATFLWCATLLMVPAPSGLVLAEITRLQPMMLVGMILGVPGAIVIASEISRLLPMIVTTHPIEIRKRERAFLTWRHRRAWIRRFGWRRAFLVADGF